MDDLFELEDDENYDDDCRLGGRMYPDEVLDSLAGWCCGRCLTAENVVKHWRYPIGHWWDGVIKYQTHAIVVCDWCGNSFLSREEGV